MYQVNNGVFEPTNAEISKAELRTQGVNTNSAANSSSSLKPSDMIGISGLVIEVILLILFSKQLYFWLIELLVSLAGLAIFFGMLVIGVLAIVRKLGHKHERWF